MSNVNNKNISLEILISTKNRDNLDFLNNIFIKNIKTGESKQVKFKQAEPLILKGEWVIFNKN